MDSGPLESSLKKTRINLKMLIRSKGEIRGFFYFCIGSDPKSECHLAVTLKHRDPTGRKVAKLGEFVDFNPSQKSKFIQGVVFARPDKKLVFAVEDLPNSKGSLPNDKFRLGLRTYLPKMIRQLSFLRTAIIDRDGSIDESSEELNADDEQIFELTAEEEEQYQEILADQAVIAAANAALADQLDQLDSLEHDEAETVIADIMASSRTGDRASLEDRRRKLAMLLNRGADVFDTEPLGVAAKALLATTTDALVGALSKVLDESAEAIAQIAREVESQNDDQLREIASARLASLMQHNAAIENVQSRLNAINPTHDGA